MPFTASAPAAARLGGMARRLLAILVLGLAWPVWSQAPQPLQREDQTRALCEDAGKQLSQLKSFDAYALLAPYWPISGPELQNLTAETQAQLEFFQGRFGQIVGLEWVHTQTAGKSLLRHHYLLKFETHAVRLQCVFYKPDTRWLVNSISWDDQLERLFDYAP